MYNIKSDTARKEFRKPAMKPTKVPLRKKHKP